MRCAVPSVDILEEEMTDLNAMWEALARYQLYADADGHGESWRVMCSERTEKAAWSASKAAGAEAEANVAWDAAEAAEAAAYAAHVESKAYWSELAIKRIEQAIKERNHD
jgi:hypothetical protein